MGRRSGGQRRPPPPTAPRGTRTHREPPAAPPRRLNSPIYVELGFPWQRQQAESLGRVGTAKEGGEGRPGGAEALTEPLPPPAALSTRRGRAASCVLRRRSPRRVPEKGNVQKSGERRGSAFSSCSHPGPRCRREEQPGAKAPGGRRLGRRAAGGAGGERGGRERLGLGAPRLPLPLLVLLVLLCRGERRLRLRAAGSVARLRQSRCAAPARGRGGRGGRQEAEPRPRRGQGRRGAERGGERCGSLPPGAGLLGTGRGRGAPSVRAGGGRREDGERSRAAARAPHGASLPRTCPGDLHGPSSPARPGPGLCSE